MDVNTARSLSNDVSVRLLLVLQWRHTEIFAKAKHKIRAIRKSALARRGLHALPHLQKSLGFYHAAGFDIGGRTRLKVGGKIAIDLAFGNKKDI